ncbi:MAG: PAS domain-containing protein, partial [Planctomycetota bacterium]
WVWEVYAQGTYTYASPKVEELLGYGVDEVLGRTPFDFMPEEEAARVRDIFEEKLSEAESFYGLENTNRHKDGHLVVLETNGIPIFDAEGKLSGYRGIDRDITKRKQAEEALQKAHHELEARVAQRTAELTKANEQLTREVAEREKAEAKTQQQNQFLNTVLESLPHPFYVVDADNYIVKIANSAALKQSGGELSGGQTCYMLTHMQNEPCNTTERPCPLEEIKRTGEPTVVEHVHYDENGKARYVEVHAYPILDDQGKLSEVIEYCLDITERKRAEKELAQKQKNLEALCEAAPIGIMVFNKDVIIEHVNPVLAGFVGKDSSAIVAKPPGEALGCIHVYDDMELCGEGPLCYLCQIRGTIEQVLTSGEPVHGVETQSTFVIGGEEVSRWLEISAAPVMIDDSEHVVLAVNDITRRKESQARLDEAQQRLLETAHRAGMAEVATDVLHNVGNVLNSITVSTITLMEKVASSEVANLEKVASIVNDNIADIGTFLTEDSQGKHIPAYLGEIAKHLQGEQTDIVGRLRALADNVEYIRDIVTTQQSYAKAYGVEVPVSLTELVEDAIQINSAGFERHGIEVIRDYEDLPEIITDKQKVLQILVNLISNAKYALIDGGKEEKSLTISIHKRDEDHALVEVADNGVGISKSDMTRIFSHGYSTRRHGHGFGLHSSALAAKGIGGTLTVHSDGTGLGATFTLGLPLKHIGSVK